MNALLYFSVAIFTAVLAGRAQLLAPPSKTRTAFVATATTTALAWAAFASSMIPGFESARLLYMFAGGMVPVFATSCVNRLFNAHLPPDPWLRPLAVITLVVLTICTTTHGVLYEVGGSTAGLVSGAWTFLVFGYALWRIATALDASQLPVDRRRLRYLIGFSTGAVLLTAAEQLVRTWQNPQVHPEASIAERTAVLQGVLPPLSTLFGIIAVYLLYHSVVAARLLDLDELVSRLSSRAAAAATLVVIDAVTVLGFGTFTDYPLHSTFQVFLASLVFVFSYDPLRERYSGLSDRLFNQRGQRLLAALAEIRRQMPGILSPDGLAELIVDRLYRSGRVPTCAVYRWSAESQAFQCIIARGINVSAPLESVAPHPFADALIDGFPYVRSTLAALSLTDSTAKERLDRLDALQADIVVPFRHAGVVLGWVTLKEEKWSDGFSAEELDRLHGLANAVSTVWANLAEFQALERDRRLAALGAMAAGLAHEIRNPLAGIKGAAQFLEEEELSGPSKEMLQVIIQETDRLNVVVSQFLDYARPLELHRFPAHFNALVAHALALIKAQRLPKSITIMEDLAGDLPALPLDRPRLTQVVLNLLQNAIQAMPEGGTLSVITRRGADELRRPVIELQVSDTGNGIPAENLERLFLPFFTTKDQGSGLGLAISQRITQAHGGEISVSNLPISGACFLLHLPLPEEPPIAG